MPETDIAKQLGATIGEKRRSLGLTQAQLAEKLDIGQDALSRMEKGKISPKLTRLPDIAAALGCPVAELFRTGTDGDEETIAQIAEMIKSFSPEKKSTVADIVKKIAFIAE